MMPADVIIWERFIDAHPKAYDWVEYDVKVGTVPDFIDDLPEGDMRNLRALYEKKIDVIGHRPGGPDIIELKPRAGAGAIGQVKRYTMLYKRDIDIASIPDPVIITDALTPDMKDFAEQEGVRLIIV